MSKIFRSIARIAPIALPFVAPGIGAALGTALGAGATAAPIVGNAVIGAASGGLSGGGVKGALLGGASGAIGGGLGEKVAGAAGLQGAGAKAASGALAGAVGGAGDGLKGALTGAALGGGFGYAMGGGMPSVFGTPSTTGPGGMGPPTRGTGIVGAVTRNAPNLVGGGLGGVSSPINTGASLLSALGNYSAQEDMEEQLLESQRRAEGALSPFLQTGGAANAQLSERLTEGFNPGDLTQDPGYQFRMQEGQRALQRGLAASGSVDSGRALKAAQEFGQGLADQTYNDAYTRWLQRNQQLSGMSGAGLNAAGTLGGIYTDQGNIQANRTLAGSNLLTGTLSSLLRGSGARQVIGYRADGTPIYSEV